MTVYRLEGRVEPPILEHASWMDQITSVDVYDLDYSEARGRILSGAGLIVPAGADHMFLSTHLDALTEFVRGGGRVLINGQITVPFIQGLAPWSKLTARSALELQPVQLNEHPVWAGVDYDDLHYRTGAPGVHSYEALVEIGVAGFYGRGYHVDIPADATVITGIGPLRLPLDYSYRIGDGEVLVHAGRDLEKYADPRYSTGAFGENLVRWLRGDTSADVSNQITAGVKA